MIKNKLKRELPHANYLSVDHLQSDLKGRSIKGGFTTVSAQITKFIFRTFSAIVLGRLLTPADYGLVGMVTAIISMALLFSDMGLSTATIQRKDITDRQVSNLFWLNNAIGLAIMLLLIATSSLIAKFYHQDKLILITILISTTYPLNCLSTQHLALLSRQMQFSKLVIIDLSSMIIGTLFGIGMALLGFGYWSLIAISIVTALVNILMSWSYCGWRPSLPRRGAGTKPLVKFGVHLTGSSITNYLARNMDNILIGWRWGTISLGLYAKAYQLFLLPLQQISAPMSAVVVPGLSRLQETPSQFKNYYVKSLGLLCSMAMPFAVFLAVLSDETIFLLLGAKWMGAAPIFRILSIASLFQPVMNTSGWLYIATTRSKAMLQWSLFSSSFFIASFFIGLPYGTYGVAKSYMLARLLLFFPSIYYASKGTPVSYRDTLRAMTPPLLASLAVGLACYLIKGLMPAGMGKWGISLLVLIVSFIASTAIILLINKKLFLSLGIHKKIFALVGLRG